MRRNVILLVAIGLVLGATAISIAATSGQSSTQSIDPSNFVRHVTNPFFPLKPGTVYVYRGVKDGAIQIDRVRVTHKTRMIEGVRTTAVRDVAKHKDRVLEATTDWYAQDKQGNVWYFGEDTKSYENGHVDTEGSWLSGRDGARPGIIMEADPHVPDGYRQEFYRGHAEDLAWVVARSHSIRVPFGVVRHVLLTLEFTHLEPQVVDKKFYGRGIGIVREISVSGPHETAELVRIRHT